MPLPPLVDLLGTVEQRIIDDPAATIPIEKERHVLDEVLQISEVPRTLSGKALDVPIKRLLMGITSEQAVSRDAIANPEELEYFVDLAVRW